MKLIKNYIDDEHYRKSMSKLSTKVFNLDFEMLYQKKYWPKEFGSYAFIDNDEVVSNICFHRLELEKDSIRYKVLQIGTVSTYKEYRNQGLSRKLIEAVIEDFESEVDVMYLFANESVLDYYPKFGFGPIKHVLFKQEDLSNLETHDNTAKKLSINEDMHIIDQCIRGRVKNSKNYYIHGDDYIKMFYCLYVFHDCIYYHEKEDAIIICQKEDDKLIVHDIFIKSKEDIKTIIGMHLDGIKSISYGFEIDLENLIPYEDEESGLHIRTKDMSLLKDWKYPITSIT